MSLRDARDVRKIAFRQISLSDPIDTAKQVGFLCKISIIIGIQAVSRLADGLLSQPKANGDSEGHHEPGWTDLEWWVQSGLELRVSSEHRRGNF